MPLWSSRRHGERLKLLPPTGWAADRNESHYLFLFLKEFYMKETHDTRERGVTANRRL